MSIKTAIVTGGATGIGAATVKSLCEEGFAVAIVYRSSEEKAKALSSSLISRGHTAFPVYADVRRTESVDAAVRQIAKKTGRIDALVNNAGVSLRALLQDTADAMYAEAMGAVLDGTFRFCRACLPYMLRAHSGSIVNIASMWGQTGGAMESVYSAAKAGVIGLTKALAKETAPSGVRVNCVSPGAVDTAMMAEFSPEDIAALCEEIPMGRLGTPEEVAAAAAFLCSDKAGYITGQVLGVNGGIC